MPGYWLPPPENMNTIEARASATLCVKTRLGSSPASSSRACSRSSATNTRRVSKFSRVSRRDHATSPSERSGFASRCVLRRAHAPSSDRLFLADICSNRAREASLFAVAADACSSRTTCAFVPPTPREFTAARRGVLLTAQGYVSSFTTKGESANAISGFGRSKFSEAGIV